ncbi:MAG: hypothetical protein ABSE55_17530 [Terracidiphilus sp.]
MRRILAISGGVAAAVAAGTVMTACTPGAGGNYYGNYYGNSYTNGQGYHDTYYTNSYTNH